MKPCKSRKPLEELPPSKMPNHTQSKTTTHTRESSISSVPSSSCHKRTSSNTSSSNIPQPQKPNHRRTFSTMNPFSTPTIQQEISSTVDQIQEKLCNEKQKLEETKKNLKNMLIKAISSESDPNTIEVQTAKAKIKRTKLEKIIQHFFPHFEKTEALKALFKKKLKIFFLAISKNKSFAVFCKDSGAWKKVYGDESIKVTKSTAGTKLKFEKNAISKIQRGEVYDLFILK